MRKTKELLIGNGSRRGGHAFQYTSIRWHWNPYRLSG
jgi:hypothetical protein